MEQLMKILEDINPDNDYATETALIDGGLLDSFAILELVSALEDAYGVEITATELVPKNFNSAQAMMPGTDGLEICRRLRAVSKVPIIILTAKESEVDYMMGLTLGGDDYMIKPFRPSILVMRIKALLRRMEMEHSEAGELVAYGDISYSGNDQAVFCRGANIGLTMSTSTPSSE